MRYNFSNMNSDSFELMVRSLNEKIFGIKCEQYGLGADGQREFVFEGDITDSSGTVFRGRTIGQVKYKYPTTKDDDYKWLKKEIESELNRFREKDADYIPDNYLFYTNIVLTPMEDIGVKDKINKYIKENNDIIPHFYVKGYDEICALLDNNRDVATSYTSHILPGDILMRLMEIEEYDFMKLLPKYLAIELEEDMCTQMEQAGSVTEKKVSIDKVCIDINVKECQGRDVFKFAQKVLAIGNKVLGYRKQSVEKIEEIAGLEKSENFVLIGGPGGGKTTICQFIAQIYRANYLQVVNYKNMYAESFMHEIEQNYSYNIKCNRIPFKIVLKEYAAWISRQKKDDNISVINYMKAKIIKITGDELSISVIRKMLVQLAWVFFFDGLDEVPETSNRQEVLKQINIFISYELKEANCDCMIIATTRMQGYNKDFDENHYDHLEVMELSKDDCINYINKLFKIIEDRIEKREEYIRIMKEAMEDETTNRLMKTPLQVAIIAILVKSGGKPPHERYSLFHQYYDIVIRREKQKGVMPTLNDNTDWLEQIHLLVAEKLQRESEGSGNPSAEISKNDLNQIIAKYIEDNEDEFYKREETLNEKEEEFLKIITERICFLCENRENFYSFSIRTLQEYFAGTYLVKNMSDAEAMQNIRKIAYKLYWRNTLLFALGYIELEKKNLENEIGLLCGEMNGADNLTKQEYTSENICLYGSWLAVDILAEDIFKGKLQNKYIRYAAEAIKLSGCTTFSKFNLITGIQCMKLHNYIKDNYDVQKEYINNIMLLYMKLNENDKNNMEKDIDELLCQCDEVEKIKFCIELLNKEEYFSDTVKNECKTILTQYIMMGKVKQKLPINVLLGLNYQNNEMKKFLFMQCINNSDLYIDFIIRVFNIKNERTAWLLLNVAEYKREQTINVTDHFEYYIFEVEKADFEEFAVLAKELDLKFIEKMCYFFISPDYAKYEELMDVVGKEEEYIVKGYMRMYHFGFGKKSQEEFISCMKDRQAIFGLAKKHKVKELMKINRCDGLGYRVACNDSVFDNLVEEGNYLLNEFHNLGDDFLISYIFVAGTQIEYRNIEKGYRDTTINRMIKLLEAANLRKLYGYRMFSIIVFIANSKYYSQLLKNIPDLYFIENMDDNQLFNEISYQRVDLLTDNDAEKIILKIVENTVNSAKENNYLTILLYIFMTRSKFSINISLDTMKEIEQLECKNDYNKLAIYFLKLCVGKYDTIEELLKCMLNLNIQKKIFYSIVLNVLQNCHINNGDKIWVLVYFLLEKENFEGHEKIMSKMIDNMIEIKSNS